MIATQILAFVAVVSCVFLAIEVHIDSRVWVAALTFGLFASTTVAAFVCLLVGV